LVKVYNMLLFCCPPSFLSPFFLGWREYRTRQVAETTRRFLIPFSPFLKWLRAAFPPLVMTSDSFPRTARLPGFSPPFFSHFSTTWFFTFLPCSCAFTAVVRLFRWRSGVVFFSFYAKNPGGGRSLKRLHMREHPLLASAWKAGLLLTELKGPRCIP